MRYRVDLESGVEISGAALQEVRDAALVGHGKTGAVFLQIHRNAMVSGSITFDILTASDSDLPDLSASSFWGSAGSTTIATPGTTGLVRFDIGASSTTRLGHVLRWKVTGVNAAIHFSIVIFLADV